MKAPDKIEMNECLFSDIGIMGVEEEVEYIRKDAIMALLDAEKEKTSIGLNELENGVEHGRMEVITSLTEKIKEILKED